MRIDILSARLCKAALPVRRADQVQSEHGTDPPRESEPTGSTNSRLVWSVVAGDTGILSHSTDSIDNLCQKLLSSAGRTASVSSFSASPFASIEG
jgi:hypothetical protein